MSPDIEHDLARVQAIYVDPRTDPVVTQLIPALARVPLARIRRATGRSERQCRNYRNGTVRPPAAILPALWRLVEDIGPGRRPRQDVVAAGHGVADSATGGPGLTGRALIASRASGMGLLRLGFLRLI